MKTQTKTIGFFAAIIFLSPLATAQTLKQTIDQTIITNPNILIKVKGWLAAKEGILKAQGGYFPSIDLYTNHGFANTETPTLEYDGKYRSGYGAILKQMIFDGFYTSSEVKRNRKLTLAEQYSTIGVADDTALLATKAYLDVLRTSEVLASARNNYSNHQRIYNMIQSRSNAGIGRKADTQQASGRLALAKANLWAAQSQYNDAKTIFNRIVGQMPRNLDVPTMPKLSKTFSTEQNAITYALANHPTLKAAKADIEEAMAQRAAAKSALFPRIDAELTATQDRNASGLVGSRRDYAAMLEAKYNIFRGGSDLARIRQTGYQIEEAKEIYNRTYRQVIESMKFSWNAYSTLQAKLPALRDHRDSSRATVSNYTKQFKLNKRTLLDLLNSENEVFSAGTEYINGRYNLLLAKFRILNSAGMLLPYMGIRPNFPK